jgi:hypothetical protein
MAYHALLETVAAEDPHNGREEHLLHYHLRSELLTLLSFSLSDNY